MDKSKNSEPKINLNDENCDVQQNIFLNDESQNEKEDNIEIIIELNISKYEKENEIYILSDNNFKNIHMNPPNEFNYFNKNNTKLYLNDKQIEFNYKIKFNEIGINKIKII